MILFNRAIKELIKDVEFLRSKVMRLENPIDLKVGDYIEFTYNSPFYTSEISGSGIVVDLNWCGHAWDITVLSEGGKKHEFRFHYSGCNINGAAFKKIPDPCKQKKP